MQEGIQLELQGVRHSSRGCTTKMETTNLMRVWTKPTTMVWNQFVLGPVVTTTSLPWTLPPQQDLTTHISSSSCGEKGFSLRIKCFSLEVLLGPPWNWWRDMQRMRACSSTSLLTPWLKWETSALSLVSRVKWGRTVVELIRQTKLIVHLKAFGLFMSSCLLSW